MQQLVTSHTSKLCRSPDLMRHQAMVIIAPISCSLKLDGGVDLVDVSQVTVKLLSFPSVDEENIVNVPPPEEHEALSGHGLQSFLHVTHEDGGI